MSPRVLVYGWYFHQNLGDDFFIEIFRALFPTLNFTFTDKITPALLNNQDAVFLGGGSFLDQAASIDPKAIPLLKTKPLFYIGIGAETDIHSTHLELLKAAKLIVLRSPAKEEEIKKLNPNVLIAHDLVYCHPWKDKPATPAATSKSVLILPNVSVLPQWDAAHWKHMAWEYFKFEFSQFLDGLLDNGYTIDFFPMCQNTQLSDDWAALEIIGKMRHRNSKRLLPQSTSTIAETLKLIGQYQTVITQRYHGIVLAEMAGVPCLAISHHDKISGGAKDALSFYGVNKSLLREKFEQVSKSDPVLALKSHPYQEVKKRVEELLSIGGTNGAIRRDQGQ